MNIRPLLFAAAAFATLGAQATVVVDALDGTPLPKASIFDRKGDIIALTQTDGKIPAIPSGSYPLSVRCIGFMPATVPSAAIDSVKLNEFTYSLPELVVGDEKHNVLHLTAYLREYTTMTTDKRCVTLFSEKIVDYMLPKEKVKKLNGWTSPRILAEKKYYRFTNPDGLDSVGSKCDMDFSWEQLANISHTFKIPDEIKATDHATHTVAGKYSPVKVWRRNGSKYEMEYDPLGDEKNHTVSPFFFKLLGCTMDFNRLESKYTFSDVEGGEIKPDDVKTLSFNFDVLGRGKLIKKVFESEQSVPMSAYYEVFVIDREYLTADDARECAANPPSPKSITIAAPEGIPALSPETQAIIDRVKALQKK